MTEGVAAVTAVASVATPTVGIHLRSRAHDILLVALIALRPLIWSGDASAWDNLAWLLLVIGALGWLVLDAWRGRLSAWRFGIGGAIAAVLLLILLPAALRSPYPSTGIGLWSMAVIHLGFAAYVMQVIPGRERLAFGALTGALVVECLIALGQWAWVLPRMTLALAGGDPSIAALENANGDLAERVANGGLFGTFTLANTLAAFLLLAAVPFIGVMRAGRGWQRQAAGVVIAIALIVALGTASKGAAVALLLAGAVVWTIHVTGRTRWLALFALCILALAVALIPRLSGLGAASATVRLGYWQGATTLIAEAPLLGHGLTSFAAYGSRAMPLDAEPTRHVHNDVLEATVDGGVLAGLALIALLGWSARTRKISLVRVNAEAADSERAWPTAWPLLLILPLFSALGMLASNVEWWPLGAGDLTWWLWPMVLAAVVIGVMWCCTQLPLPPTWAWQLALTAFALHCLVDFNFQSPAIWGTLIVVAVLAGGRVYAVGVCTISRSTVTALVLMLSLGFFIGLQRVAQQQRTAQLLQVGVVRGDPRVAIAEFQQRAPQVMALAQTWPADVSQLLTLVSHLPESGDRLPFSTAVSARLPWNATASDFRAHDLAHVGRWDDALIAAQHAIACEPAFLLRRQRLMVLLAQAAQALPTRSAEFQTQIDQERQRLIELSPIVHPRHRLPKPLTSRLPVQPAP